ncbi:MAG: autotransporter domain-containing protein, partial [Sphingomonas sp.]
TVANGATLGGTGTIAALTVASGGTVAPGTGVGTIVITGNFAQASGSIYAAETTAAGLSDRITVGGTATIASGAQLAVTRGTGTYGIGQRYTLLTATGGVSGTYTLVQTANGGTEFRLAQTGTGVFVDVARTAASLPSIAATRNQAAVAPALAALGVGNAAYAALTLIPSDDAVRAGLDTLSGEAHASLRTTMLKDAQGAEDAVRSRLLSPTTGSGIWAQALGHSGEDDGATGTASAERHGWGGVGGVDIALDDQARVGIAGGYTRTKVGIDARDSFGKVESTHALAYAGGMLGPVVLRTGAGYAWTKTDLTRGVVFPAYAARLTSNYDGDVLHGFAEIGLPHAMFGGTVEPFA